RRTQACEQEDRTSARSTGMSADRTARRSAHSAATRVAFSRLAAHNRGFGNGAGRAITGDLCAPVPARVRRSAGVRIHAVAKSLGPFLLDTTGADIGPGRSGA